MSYELSPTLPPKRPFALVTVLRWVAVLPAAIGAWIGVQLLVILANAAVIPRWSDWWLELINSAMSSYAFVYAGAATAPKHNFIVGIVVAILYGIFMVVIITAGFFIKTSVPLWRLVLSGVISLVATIAAVVKLREEY
jgi:hypothetical protein